MMHRITALHALGCSIALVAACSSDAPANNGDVDGGSGSASGADGGGTSGGGNQDGGASGDVDSGGTGTNGDASPTSGQDAGPSGTGCGACPTGFSCAAGDTVCKSAGGIPHFGHVYVVLMENQDQTAIVGSTNAPYINTLYNANARTTSYSAVAHPSLPNYIALTSGDTQGIACDCHPGSVGTACAASSCQANNPLSGNCDCTRNGVDHLGKQLDVSGQKWRIYGEDMGTPCNIKDSGNYAARHIPFLYYDDVRTNAAYCQDHVVDYKTAFASDLGHYAFSFITPNLCNDMHTACGSNQVKQGDDWAKANLPGLLAAPGFASDSILFLVWDEGGLFGGQTVGLVAVSPLAKAPYSSPTAYDHYSLLATIEEGLGLPKLGKAKTAAVMKDLFK